MMKNTENYRPTSHTYNSVELSMIADINVGLWLQTTTALYSPKSTSANHSVYRGAYTAKTEEETFRENIPNYDIFLITMTNVFANALSHFHVDQRRSMIDKSIKLATCKHIMILIKSCPCHIATIHVSVHAASPSLWTGALYACVTQ